MIVEGGSIPLKDLVYDVGMHQGEDTSYYLAKGYRVVGVEAHPTLARECRERFAEAIEAGNLIVVEGAVVERAGDAVTFYVNRNPLWGSIDPAWVRKKRVMRAQEPISVAAVDLAACMRQYGVPHYLKIDIEGADRLCLEALKRAPGLPDTLSIETELFDLEALAGDLKLLEQLGYRRFAVVKQGAHGEIETRTLSGEPLTYRFPSSASGPFGEDLGAWVSRRAALRRHRRAFRRRQAMLKSETMVRLTHPIWSRSSKVRQLFTSYYDTHAKR